MASVSDPSPPPAPVAPRLPPRPAFDNPADARADAKRRLVAAFRIFWKLGYDEGVMGHISFRDPEYPDRFWQNPFARSFALMRVSDLVCINMAGEQVEGDGYPHVGGVPLHASIYAANPEAQAVVHTHAPASKAWSTLGRTLAPISTEAATFFGRQAIYDSYANGEGLALGEASRGNRAVIMQSHGIVTLGESVDEAAYLFISLEKACAEQLVALAAGEPLSIAEEHARAIAARPTTYAGWLNFQPAYETVLHEQPDLAL